MKVGRLTLFLIERGGRYAIRMCDPESSMRKQFTGLRWYPIAENWRIEAKFVSYSAPRQIAFATVIGTVEEMLRPRAGHRRGRAQLWAALMPGAACRSSTPGSRIVKVVPRPGALLTRIAPACERTMPATADKPSPRPGNLVV